MNTILHIIKDHDLLKKIGFVLGFLILFRVAAAIPIPGIDAARLSSFLGGNQFFGLLNIFSGGGLDNLSIVMLGVGPYITASIIMQLLTMVFPQFKALYHEEGEAGRRRFNQYARLITVPLAFIQGYGLITLLTRQGVIDPFPLPVLITNLFVVMTGSLLLMWLGEIISEYGIGNGVSLIIFAGIVAGIPQAIRQALFTFDASQIPLYLGFFAVSLVITAGVVMITEGERPIPVTYAKRVRGMRMYGGVSTYLPLRVNQAGVIPIIFALSLLLFPQMIVNFLSSSGNAIVQTISSFLLTLLSNLWLYGFFYFLLVFVFTYFYTAVTFDPKQISENLQKAGGFIPGIRPGRPTADYLTYIINRTTLIGALFLGFIAVLPLIMQGATGTTTLAIGGTALLIVVSVVLETVKQIQAHLATREYE
jgi:preprotein translocase subunit SecY